MNSQPSGTVTFLFTDIEGSTKLAQGHPDQWESLRARHHAILQSSMDAHNGYVFQIIGDAFCVAFHTASDGLNAAIDAQRSFQTEDWDDTPIKVRMGIHTGEAQSHNNEYHGYLTLSLVQRIMSAGHGGQILLSNANEILLRGQLPKDVTLRDMGEHKFKDVIQLVRVFQVVAPDLQSDFPALHALDVFPNNLPTQLTSFVGREKELEDVKKLLQDSHVLTLIGPGGTGKTRLSLQSANESLTNYSNGVWLVELAPILDPLLVPRTTAIAIGLRDEPQRPVIDMLCDYLREKRMLILLDNCEHLVNGCAQMANKILQAAPYVRILASSREALGIAGEVTYRVPSLGLPDLGHLPSYETLDQYEAVKLFIDRAVAAVSTFAVTNDNAPALAQICHRLDGIPLAIELAAAKVRVLNVEQIAKRLDDRFRLLTGGSRTAMERHQTLRATIDWGYNLLTPSEQVLFRRLSVFVGGWTLEAAESVCGFEGLESVEVLDVLTHLVDKSFVMVDEGAKISRYRMLETIRQYAREKLTGSGEADIIRDRHLDYFLKLKESAEPKLRSAQQLIWLNLLEAEHDNLRTAVEWSLGRDDPEVGLRFTGTGWFFWGMRGYSKEGARFLKTALEKPGAEERSAVRARALTGMAYMARYQGDLLASTNAALEGVEIWREVGDNWWLAFTLGRLGGNLLIQSNLLGARQIQEEAVKLAREADDKWALGDVLGNLGRVFKNSGDYQTARSFQEEGLAVYRIIGDKSCIAEALEELGALAHIQGDYEQAAVLYEEGLEICRELHYVGTLLSLLIVLGCIRQSQGDNEKAATLFTEALVLAQEAGLKEGPAYALAGLGGVAAAGGRPEQAALLLGASESIFTALGVGIFSSYNQCLADYNRWLASTRSQLGETALNKAWAEGAAMSTEEAVQYALREIST